MNIILLGAPGAGKGTQAEIISKKLNIPSISTGGLLRAAVADGTEAGVKAKSFMDAGALVPDEVVVAILKDRIANPDCEGGYILDGFPRNTTQAETLDRLGVSIDIAISIEVADDVIVKRLSGRRVCPKCGATFHVDNAPSAKGELCDVCDEKLIIRSDDNEETIKNRLATFHDQTEPLKGFYEEKGLLKLVETEGIEETTAVILDILKEAN